MMDVYVHTMQLEIYRNKSVCLIFYGIEYPILSSIDTFRPILFGYRYRAVRYSIVSSIDTRGRYFEHYSQAVQMGRASVVCSNPLGYL